MKSVPTILAYLGYPNFTDAELTEIFGKKMSEDETISFKRLLVGSGLCYYKKRDQVLKAKAQAQAQAEAQKEKKEAKNVQEQQEEDAEEEEKEEEEEEEEDILQLVSPKGNEFHDEESAEDRYAVIAKGLDVVKAMFDVIDVDGSGEITQNEFRQAFIDVCKDPEIVDARMKELDYNQDQEITFREFLFGISSWVGFDDLDFDEPTEMSYISK
jgi:NACalpha-BTF3-like transcription factor